MDLQGILKNFKVNFVVVVTLSAPRTEELSL